MVTTRVFVGAICAVFFTVTEETSLDAGGVSASQVSVLTQRLLGVQQGLHLTLLVLQLAVFDCVFPVTCLFFNVKEQTGWATDGLDTLL